MKVFPKIAAWLAGIAAIVVVLAMAAILLAPFWMNQELVKQTLVDAVSQQLSGTLQYRRIEILLLPKPHLILHRSRFRLNGNVEGRVATIGIFPKIIPLIDGRIQIANVRVEQPQIIWAPGPASSGEVDPRALLTPAVNALARFFNHPVIKSDSRFEFKDGRLRIDGGRQSHQFQQLNAKFRYGRFTGLTYAVDCTSSLWEHLSLEGRIRLNTARGRGRLRCVNFQPAAVFDRLTTDSSLRTTDGRLDVDLRFSTNSVSDVNIEAEGAVPYWVLQKGIDRTVIKIRRFNTVISLTPDHVAWSLANLDVSHPAVQLSGNFVYNRRDADVRLDLSCLGLDATALRRHILAITDDVPQVKEIFNVVQSGRVPTLRLNASGRSLKDLGRIRNYLIKGRMRDGRIFVPGPDLDLTQVAGDVEIADGVLRGHGLSARLGNSSGRDGRLTLGLISIAEPFLLDILVDADLPQLPAVLAKQIPNRSFGREMRDLNILSGSASGRLVLEQGDQDIQTMVQVFGAELHADYRRIPYPVKLRIAAMSYQHQQIYFEIPEATVGDSILSDLMVAVDWRQSTLLDITTASAELRLQQVHDCLTHERSPKRSTPPLVVHGGRGLINNLRIRGPAGRIAQWRIDMTGTLQAVPLEWTTTDQAMTLKKAVFRAQENSAAPETGTEIRFDQADLQWGSSLVSMTGTLGVSGRGLRIDLDATADDLNAEQFESLAGEESGRWHDRLSGRVRLTTDRFQYHDWMWQDLDAEILLDASETSVQISRASFCGISTTGVLTHGPESFEMAVFPIASDMALSPTLTCLFGREDIITGKFNLSGQLHTTLDATGAVQQSSGSLAAVAESGRIYRYTALSKILALINITELFKGKLPDLVQGGFAYRDISAKADVRNNELMVTEMIIDGASMTIVARGKYDLTNRQFRFTVLVAPLKSIDSIIKNLPVTSLIFGNTLVSFPFLIEGTPEDYDVVAIGPLTVAPELSKILNRRLKSPVQIYNPEKLHPGRRIDN